MSVVSEYMLFALNLYNVDILAVVAVGKVPNTTGSFSCYRRHDGAPFLASFCDLHYD